MGILKALDNVGGLRGLASNAVTGAYYNSKTAFDNAGRNLKSTLTESSRKYDEDDDDEAENRTSEYFAKRMGFSSVKECDEYYKNLEKALKEAEEDDDEDDTKGLEARVKDITKDEFRKEIKDTFSGVFSEYTDERIASMNKEEKEQLMMTLQLVPEAIDEFTLALKNMVKEANELFVKISQQEQTQNQAVAGYTAENIVQDLEKAKGQVIPPVAPFIQPMQQVSAAQ